MVQIPVWPLPYWATACLLVLPALLMLRVAWWCGKHSGFDSKYGYEIAPLLFVASLLIVSGVIAYSFCVPGFYFHLALKDVQWAYLEAK